MVRAEKRDAKMLGETENLRTVDVDKGGRLLTCLERIMSKSGVTEDFQKVLEGARQKPLLLFTAALEKSMEQLEGLHTDIFQKMVHNPDKLLRNGIMVGFALALATTDPRFQDLLSTFEKDPNCDPKITPITAGRRK